MANLLFVERQLRNEKLGLMALSAVARAHGHQTRLVESELEDLHRVMEAFRPDFVGYSLMTGEHRQALETNRELKSRYPFQSIFGGPHCTFFPEILDEEGVDYLVQGAGDELLPRILQGEIPPGSYRGDLVADLDQLPFPDRELVYRQPRFRDNPIKNVMTIRDCPYSCAYCYNHQWKELYQDQRRLLYRRRSVENVIEELLQLQALYPLKKVNFLDDSFIQKRDWLFEFCEAYERRIGLPFLVNVRADRVDEEIVAALKRAGLEMVNFALESASPYVQQKVLNRGRIDNGQIGHAIELFQQYGIRIRMQNMIGLPVPDPLGDALNTLEFNLRHRVEDSWVAIFQPYPRTALADYCKRHGYIDEVSLEHCADSFFDESRLNIPDKEKIYRLQKWWYFIVHHNLTMESALELLELPLSPEMAEHLKERRFTMSRRNFYGLE